MTSTEQVTQSSQATTAAADAAGSANAPTAVTADPSTTNTEKTGAQTPEMTQSATHAPVSPSGSISSVSSSESTRKLISSLSTNKLAPGIDASNTQPGNSHIVVSPVLQQNNFVNTSAPAKSAENKKPIKFTVRKVSRDSSLPVVTQPKPAAKKEYLYGNIPENRHKVVERKSSDKASSIQANQAKYDSYVSRIEKIDKEIRFLTNLLPPYNVEIDYATRTKITRAIEKLGMKKDEVEKKKYSLGIAISRSWREYDENSTWVRSVSNH